MPPMDRTVCKAVVNMVVKINIPTSLSSTTTDSNVLGDILIFGGSVVDCLCTHSLAAW